MVWYPAIFKEILFIFYDSTMGYYALFTANYIFYKKDIVGSFFVLKKARSPPYQSRKKLIDRRIESE